MHELVLLHVFIVDNSYIWRAIHVLQYLYQFQLLRRPRKTETNTTTKAVQILSNTGTTQNMQIWFGIKYKNVRVKTEEGELNKQTNYF